MPQGMEGMHSARSRSAPGRLAWPPAALAALALLSPGVAAAKPGGGVVNKLAAYDELF
jgi:hypothetical protein